MPVLENSRWEKFAQCRAEGMQIDPAHVKAGYKSNPGNAGRLNNNEQVRARIEELQGADAAIITSVKELARQHTEAAVNCLVRIMDDKKAPASANAMAAIALLDRGHGKAPQTIEVEPSLYDNLDLATRLVVADALRLAIGIAEGDTGGPGPTQH